MTTSGVLALLIFHGRVVNATVFSPSGLKFVYAAFLAGQHQVLDAHVGKRAARHHAVVAAARAVAVEILRTSRRSRCRYFPAGDVFLMAPAGEMWSVVTLSPKMPSARAPLISRNAAGLQREILEERRFLDVSATLRPTHKHCRRWTGFRSTSDFARRNPCRACGKLPACSAACIASRTSCNVGQSPSG